MLIGWGYGMDCINKIFIPFQVLKSSQVIDCKKVKLEKIKHSFNNKKQFFQFSEQYQLIITFIEETLSVSCGVNSSDRNIIPKFSSLRKPL